MERTFLVVVLVSVGLVNSSCPLTCACTIETLDLLFVDCNSRSLSYVPDLPSNTYTLQMSHNTIPEINDQVLQRHTTFDESVSTYFYYIYKNVITTMTADIFTDCNNLTSINLSFNSIEYLHPGAFRNLTELTNLALNINKIRYIESNTFINLQKLYYLYLQDNEISTIQQFAFVNLPSLHDLYLNANNISHIKEHAFGNLPSLSILELNANPFKCDCSVIPFRSWLNERASIGTDAKCSDGTLVTSLHSAALETCNRK
ncbi:unnamed protein product [Mytilus edulis]|uniref:LRRCT domain-containing protein n=1 Tax=Mytilus edulis TaxID=6550 RepID=A0A8S3V7N0_MYTED|nr:unnamed protein product [Mytilus edulis]